MSVAYCSELDALKVGENYERKFDFLKMENFYSYMEVPGTVFATDGFEEDKIKLFLYDYPLKNDSIFFTRRKDNFDIDIYYGKKHIKNLFSTIKEIEEFKKVLENHRDEMGKLRSIILRLAIDIDSCKIKNCNSKVDLKDFINVLSKDTAKEYYDGKCVPTYILNSNWDYGEYSVKYGVVEEVEVK